MPTSLALVNLSQGVELALNRTSAWLWRSAGILPVLATTTFGGTFDVLFITAAIFLVAFCLWREPNNADISFPGRFTLVLILAVGAALTSLLLRAYAESETLTFTSYPQLVGFASITLFAALIAARSTARFYLLLQGSLTGAIVFVVLGLLWSNTGQLPQARWLNSVGIHVRSQDPWIAPYEFALAGLLIGVLALVITNFDKPLISLALSLTVVGLSESRVGVFSFIILSIYTLVRVKKLSVETLIIAVISLLLAGFLTTQIYTDPSLNGRLIQGSPDTALSITPVQSSLVIAMPNIASWDLLLYCLIVIALTMYQQSSVKTRITTAVLGFNVLWFLTLEDAVQLSRVSIGLFLIMLIIVLGLKPHSGLMVHPTSRLLHLQSRAAK